LVHDRQGIFEKEIRKGLVNLSQIILGANSLIQAILPDIFNEVPRAFAKNVNRVLKVKFSQFYNTLDFGRCYTT
jgi:tyrosine aminotransferase